MDNVTQGWVLATASGLACVLGASVVFFDVVLSRVLCLRYIQITNSKAVLIASLSLASGIMLYSSFNTLLPEAQKHLAQSKHFSKYTRMTALVFYFIGVIGSVLITKLVHKYLEHTFEGESMSETYNVNVAASSDTNERSPLVTKRHRDSKMSVRSTDTNGYSVCDIDSDSENSVASDTRVHHDDACGRKNDLFHGHHHHHHHFLQQQHHHFPQSFQPPTDRENDENSAEDRQRLMRIGIQTALAISIHKFPEGLIMFITSQASQSLGFAFFIAIALHNISEGFAIALPLYMATQSRIKSFLYAAVLGGMSQPFGALLGWLFMGSLRHWDHHGLYGMIFSCVSGLMSLISVQGMLPQAMKSDSSNGQTVSVYFFLGVLIMGMSHSLVELHN